MWLKKFNIISIVIFAFLIRLISLNQSLWWDEAINVVYARQSEFIWFVTKYPLGDFHPPGWFFILWIWGHIFGWSEVSVRMPSVIFGVFTVYLTYLIGKKLYSKNVGLISALMLSLAPLHIYYSQEARMYSFAAFAVSFLIFSFIKVIKEEKYGLFFFVISLLLVLYSDYVAYFIFSALLIYLLLFENKAFKKFLLPFGLSFIFFIPWIFSFLQQLAIGQKTALLFPGWKGVVGSSSVKEILILPIKILFGRISIENNILYAFLFALISSPFLFVFLRTRQVLDKKYYLILFWLILPVIFAWIFSFFIPIFSYFRLLFILPAFYIAVSICLDKFSSLRFKKLLIIILIFELIPACAYLFNKNFQREDWKGGISYVEQSINTKDRSSAIFENTEIPSVAKYYGNNLSYFQPGITNNLKMNLTNINNVYLFDYLVEVYDPKRIVAKELINLGFVEIKTYNFTGLGFVRLYVKQ